MFRMTVIFYNIDFQLLKWIIDANSGIEIFISPHTVFKRIAKKIFKSNIWNLPAIIFYNIGAFKAEANIESYQEIIKVKPETHTGGNTQLPVQILKFKLCSISASIRFCIFEIPDISNISKKCHFKKYGIRKQRELH